MEEISKFEIEEIVKGILGGFFISYKLKKDIYGEVFDVFITDKMKESLKEKKEMMTGMLWEIISQKEELYDFMEETDCHGA